MSATIRWMTAASLIVCCCASARSQETEVLRIDTTMVTVNVSVTNSKGHHFAELQAQDFLVRDEGKPVKLEFFDSHGPASIVLVVDISSSMKGRKWRSLRAGLKEFLTTAHEGNDYTLIAFNEKARLVAYSVSPGELWQHFQSLNPNGDTALYDAVLLGLSTLERVPQRHKALVLLSDGEDNSSGAGLARIQQEVLSHRVTVYTVGLLLDPHDLSPFEHDGRGLLKGLAAGTGGLVHFPDSEEISEVLKTINTDVERQYSLSYYPPNKASGWRSIEVTLAQDPRRCNLRYQQRYLMR